MVACNEFSVLELRFRFRLPVGMAMDRALFALFSAKPPTEQLALLLAETGTAGRGEEPERLRLEAGTAVLPEELDL